MNRCVWVNASLVRTSFLLRRGIDLKKIATGMNGASGAESKAVCTEAGFVKSASFGLGFLSSQREAGWNVRPARAAAARDTRGL